MQTFTTAKLIDFFLNGVKKPDFYLVMCDESILKSLALESLTRQRQGNPIVFSGKGAIKELVEAASMGSLFASQPPTLIELDPKLTEKQWNDACKELARLPKPREFLVYFLASISQRNTIKDVSPFSEVIISWGPNDLEAQRALKELLKKYTFSKKYNAGQVDSLIGTTLEYYASDLLACDSHFSRMEKTGSSFEEALSSQTEVKSFHVTDALASGNAAIIELRIQQCALAGEEASLILKTIASFLRQVLEVKVRLQKTSNIDVVFRELEIRQPLQQIRIKKAVQNISEEKINNFFFTAADLEMQLRTLKKPYDWLAQEIIPLVK